MLDCKGDIMHYFRILGVAIAFMWAGTSYAADLTKIDRIVKKEPAYLAKPKYCLLVFGPEAKERVWLVLDGDKLYVDRNGNGDLTEPGKRIEAPVFHETNNAATASTGSSSIKPIKRMTNYPPPE
jgi:hypothetical protein